MGGLYLGAGYLGQYALTTGDVGQVISIVGEYKSLLDLVGKYGFALPFYGGFTPDGFAHVFIGDDPGYTGGFAMDGQRTVIDVVGEYRNTLDTTGEM